VIGRYASSVEQVVATCRAPLERGYLKATEGNVSVRVPGEQAFAVTPSSCDYAKMRADDIIVLDFEQKRLEGARKASIEAGMHAAVYRERAYIGGTLSANPLSCAAGYFAITEMERTNAPVIAGRAGDRLTAGLCDIIRRCRLPFVAYNQGSIVHLETSGVVLLDLKHPFRLAKELKPRKHMLEEMGAAYTANGVITLAGSRMYTSMADTDDVIDAALERFERVLASVEGA